MIQKSLNFTTKSLKLTKLMNTNWHFFKQSDVYLYDCRNKGLELEQEVFYSILFFLFSSPLFYSILLFQFHSFFSSLFFILFYLFVLLSWAAAPTNVRACPRPCPCTPPSWAVHLLDPEVVCRQLCVVDGQVDGAVHAGSSLDLEEERRKKLESWEPEPGGHSWCSWASNWSRNHLM